MADFQQPFFSKRPPASTLSKKSSISNGNGSVYSEVFGGPTKTYSAARIDDYAEIFSNFYAPKPPSTIPFLDFPESDGGDFLSHSFDYSEIFGVLDGSDFAVPYDDLFSNPPPDSRTPAEKDSHCQTAAVFSRVPSKEHNVDHLAHPEKNGSLSNGSSHHYDCAQLFNVSYNKANQGGKDDSITGITHIAQLHEVSGFTYVVDECNPSQMTRSDKCLPQSTCDLDINEGSKGKAAEGNHLRQATLYAPVCTSVIKASKDDLKEDKHQLESNAPVSGQHHIQHDGDKSFPGKVFLTVSEINLLTQPSQVPPPSRPPPRLFLKRGDSERMVDSNTRGNPDEVHVFKAPTNNRAYIRRTVSETDAHEDAAKNSSLPCFDVEVDASSAAAASVAAMKDAMEKAEAKIRSAKQSMERKRDNFPNRTKLGVNEDRKVKERREGKIAQEHKTGELNQEICDVDNNKKLDFAVDQKHKNLKAAHIGPDEGYIELAKESIGKWQRKESKVTIESHKQGNETDKRNLQKHFCHPVKDDRFEVAQEVSVKANEHKLNEKHSVGIEEKEKKMARKEAFDWEENDGSLKATSKDVHEMMENKEMSNRAHEQEENEKKVNKVYEQEETELKLKVAREENEKRLKEAREREENEKRIKAAQEACEREENRKRLKAAQEAHEREENEKRKAAQEAREREENEKRIKAAQKAREQEENQKRLKEAQEAREREENEKRLKAAQEAREREENEKRLKEAQEVHEREENEKRLKAAQEAHEREENEKRLKAAQEAHEREENEKRLKAAQKAREQEENEKRLRAAQEARMREEHEMRLKAAQEAHEREEHEKRLRAAQEAHEREEYEKKLKAEQEAREREEHEKQLKAEQEANEQEENERRLKAAQAACGQEENEKSLKESLEALEQEENERRSKEAQEACEKEGNEKRSKEAQDAHEREKHENLRASQETYEGKEDKKPLEAAQVSWGHEQEMKLRTAQEIAAHEENVKKLKTAEDAYDWQENEMKFEAAWDAYEQEENHDRPKADHEHVYEVEMKSKAGKEAQGCENHRKLEATKLLEEQKNSKNTLEAAQEVYVQNTSEQGENDKKLKPSQDPYEHEGNRMKLAGAKPEVNKSKLPATQRAFSEDGTVKKAAVENAHEQEENGKELKMTLETAGSEKVEKKMKAAEEVLQDGDSENLREAKKADGRQENERKTEASQSSIEPVQINQKIFLANAALDRGEHENNDREADVTLDSEEKKNHSRTAQAVFQWLENVRKLKEAQAGMLEEKENVVRTAPGFTLGPGVERKVKNAHDTSEIEQKERDRLQRERELEMERSRKIEEEREREREREKDRIAVERATREARDRTFTEARERAERVAVEKATTEARQRALTEALERVEKASAEAREKSIAEKASAEARLRAERAAVERATAEARERAAERAALEARERAERKGGIRQSSSFSDVRDFSHESQSRVEGESAKRSKARLERHQRTVERAAKALAEKNMRDILAQREQAERNRLAETLDADVRRWSNGKEGNLRALLSTLQYILGPDSGWQPVPLTDVITANAVKKAYRKATLCVHPDKVQQRGASIQQKYICEKVFDLLKEAWNKFNSEER